MRTLRTLRTRVLATALFLVAVAVAFPAAAQIGLPAPDSPGARLAGKAADVEDAAVQSIVIRRPGSYFLQRDLLAGEGTAIDIRSDDVTLDLRGHSIVGLGDRIGTAVAVTGASNVRVFGGKIRDFGIGVKVEDSTNVHLSGLQIHGQDLGGAPPEVEIGVLILDSRGIDVRDNTVSDTFLGIFVRGGGSGANRIAENLIAGRDHGELAICYNPAPDADSAAGPSGDVIFGNAVSRYRRAFSFSAESTGNVLRGNSFAYFDLGVVEATPGSNLIDNNVEVQIAP